MSESFPRSNAKMLNDVTKSYEKALYSNDGGMWTVFEIVKRPIAKVASEGAANELIKRLQASDSTKLNQRD